MGHEDVVGVALEQDGGGRMGDRVGCSVGDVALIQHHAILDVLVGCVVGEFGVHLHGVRYTERRAERTVTHLVRHVLRLVGRGGPRVCELGSRSHTEIHEETIHFELTENLFVGSARQPLSM